MRELFRMLKQALEAEKDAVLVTVVASSGSTPRGAGARMLITKEGRIRGTIGGGAVEHQAELVAKEVLETKNSHMEPFYLRKNDIQDLGMICGGDVSVHFAYMKAGDPSAIALADRIEKLYQEGEACWLLIDITDGGQEQAAEGNQDSLSETSQTRSAAMAVYGKKSGLLCMDGMTVPAEILDSFSSRPAQLEAEGRHYYCEKLIQSGRVYIFGGGHVSQALVPVLSAVDFRCVILEDREEFTRPELFPDAEKIMLIDNQRISDFVTITEDDYVCIMTRGHKDDMITQAQVLRTPARYIGVIGSARKTAGVFGKLKEMGLTDQDLKRITTPIGLPIKAETPAEIAVSIAAQMILVRAEKHQGKNL